GLLRKDLVAGSGMEQERKSLLALADSGRAGRRDRLEYDLGLHALGGFECEAVSDERLEVIDQKHVGHKYSPGTFSLSTRTTTSPITRMIMKPFAAAATLLMIAAPLLAQAEPPTV